MSRFMGGPADYEAEKAAKMLGTKLTFEAFIEDDGGCVHLKT
jgi:hypothetical protein